MIPVYREHCFRETVTDFQVGPEWPVTRPESGSAACDVAHISLTLGVASPALLEVGMPDRTMSSATPSRVDAGAQMAWIFQRTFVNVCYQALSFNGPMPASGFRC